MNDILVSKKEESDNSDESTSDSEHESDDGSLVDRSSEKEENLSKAEISDLEVTILKLNFLPCI